MPFSHHSHSGQFCNGHAKDSLEDVVKRAVALNMQVLALTEHIPRELECDLYPEELSTGIPPAFILATQKLTFDAYHAEARRLQAAYANRITLLVGFETDWIRPSYRLLIDSLLSTHQYDIIVGSVHHVHGHPIDYDLKMYASAQQAAVQKAAAIGVHAPPEELLFADYFDAQLEMLQALRPPVVGHFDLIRLLSEDPGRSLRTWSRVWRKVLRNLLFVKEYGGCLEVSSAGWRKGLMEPYPNRELCERFMEMKGKFVISDDSHGVGQVGFKYAQLLDYLEEAGVERVTLFERGKPTRDERFPGISTREVFIMHLWNHAFFG